MQLVSKLVSKTKEEMHEKSSKNTIWRGIDLSRRGWKVGCQNLSWKEARWLTQRQTILGEDGSMTNIVS